MMKPLEDRLIIEPDKLAEKTDSGIIIPDGAMKSPTVTGTVVAVGNTVEDKIKVGDRVMWLQGGGIHVELEGEYRVFLRYVDLLSVL